jgi:16S rRNA (cytidine1402-2'-O)-methyltransferase
VSALLLSGMPVDQFQFIGFLPPKLGKKKTKLETFKNYNKTIIAYESPYKIVKTLQAMQEVYGDIDICLCRELTKLHEEVLTKPISAWLLYYQEKIPKGEFVLLFVPY